MLPIKLTNTDIRNSEAYKEYYAVATGATPPKTKASVQKTKSSFDTMVTPPPIAAAGIRLSTSTKGKEPAKASKKSSDEEDDDDVDEGSVDQDDDDDAQDDNDDQDDEDQDDDDQDEEDDDQEEKTKDEESFDPIPKMPKHTNDEGNDEENLGLNVGMEERQDEEDDKDELYRDANINLERRELTLFLDNLPDGCSGSNHSGSSSIACTNSHSSTIATISTVPQAPTHLTTASSTLLIVQRYMDQRMNEAVKVAVQIQSDRLRDEAQAENEEFLKNLDENIQKIIKEQVKEHVKVQVSKILPKIKQTMNEQLKAKVLTRLSNSLKTSYAVAADLSEMVLKKILIEKMEGNKSIHRSNKQRNLYKALVEAYEYDKIILDIYGDTFTLKRRRDDDADKDEEPFARSDRGPRDEEKEGSQSQQALEKRKLPGPLARLHKGLNLNKRLQASLGASSRKYTTFVTKTKAADYGHIKWIEDLVPQTMWIQELVGYDKHALWGISHWGRKRQQFYEITVNRESARDITVRRDNDKLHKFKEGDFKRLRIQDIEDMLLLLVQGKLTNLTVEGRFAFNVSLKMFTRSIVIQRRVEDPQLGVESYQKKLNLTRPNTYHFDLKHKEAYTAYSNLRGFIYQNKDKQNRLMRIDELHKFSDGTLTDVCTALDDHLKGIRMKYLP
uniref:Retrovirus-related Pol polyprotein from transposon TNT 1-94 n=1 Tax=Tanacetum cinerariifolium TaxID=118510 RepID=A0A6L2KJX2_TANCI|nr:hypothetical protein [Tanacetum cinerariifolium]